MVIIIIIFFFFKKPYILPKNTHLKKILFNKQQHGEFLATNKSNLSRVYSLNLEAI